MQEDRIDYSKKEENWICKNVADFPIIPDWPDENMVPLPRAHIIEEELLEPYRGEMATRYIHALIAAEKDRIMKSQSLVFEEKKQKIRTEASLSRELISYEIYEDTQQHLIYVQVGGDDEKHRGKQLCSFSNYRSYLLVSHYLSHAVLKVTWSDKQEGVYFRIEKDGITVKKFLNVMRSSGVVFRFSRRCEHDVTNVLISYMIKNAITCEIPHFLGWNRMRYKKWHFAKPGEVVMMEVWENAI